jgi:hypothetical protein
VGPPARPRGGGNRGDAREERSNVTLNDTSAVLIASARYVTVLARPFTEMNLVRP